MSIEKGRSAAAEMAGQSRRQFTDLVKSESNPVCQTKGGCNENEDVGGSVIPHEDPKKRKGSNESWELIFMQPMQAASPSLGLDFMGASQPTFELQLSDQARCLSLALYRIRA